MRGILTNISGFERKVLKKSFLFYRCSMFLTNFQDLKTSMCWESGKKYTSDYKKRGLSVQMSRIVKVVTHSTEP